MYMVFNTTHALQAGRHESIPSCHACTPTLRRTYLTVSPVKHVAKLDHHGVAATPEGSSISILFKYPRNLQGGDGLLQIPMNVSDCRIGREDSTAGMVQQKVGTVYLHLALSGSTPCDQH